jgi:hypothetical protein
VLYSRTSLGTLLLNSDQVVDEYARCATSGSEGLKTTAWSPARALKTTVDSQPRSIRDT